MRLAKDFRLPVLGSIHAVLNQDQQIERKHKMKLFAAGGAALIGMYFVLMVLEIVQRSMVA